MDYRGRYPFFDFNAVTTYPIAERPNTLRHDGLVYPEMVTGAAGRWCDEPLAAVVDEVKRARAAGLPVILFHGAHIIKLGFSPLVVELMARGIVTHVATNGAGSIHDMELALIGETSENVPNALPAGLFGMAEETGRLLNLALLTGNREKLGYGESVGRMIATGEPGGASWPYRQISILGRAWELEVPATVHATMGTDIIDQHPTFDGEAKGGASGRDFGVFAAAVCRLGGGGVVLNVGSAITGPEVLLKTVSMAANIGHPPTGLVTANFDLRTGTKEDIDDPLKEKYYYRDIKSVVTRIPQAFGGRGYMVAGNYLDSFPALFDLLTR